jgi:hypothetical protein
MCLWQYRELTALLADNHKLQGYVLSRCLIVDHPNFHIALFKIQQISIERRLFLPTDARSHFLVEGADLPVSFHDHFFITGLNGNGNFAGHLPTEDFELPVGNLLSHLHPGLIDGCQIFFAQFDLF